MEKLSLMHNPYVISMIREIENKIREIGKRRVYMHDQAKKDAAEALRFGRDIIARAARPSDSADLDGEKCPHCDHSPCLGQFDASDIGRT